MEGFTVGGDKVLGVTFLYGDTAYFTRWKDAGYTLTMYLWRDGSYCAVRIADGGNLDRIDEDDCLDLCERKGMPDAWISSN